MFGLRFKENFRSVKCESFNIETGEIVKVSYISKYDPFIHSAGVGIICYLFLLLIYWFFNIEVSGATTFIMLTIFGFIGFLTTLEKEVK